MCAVLYLVSTNSVGDVADCITGTRIASVMYTLDVLPVPRLSEHHVYVSHSLPCSQKCRSGGASKPTPQPALLVPGAGCNTAGRATTLPEAVAGQCDVHRWSGRCWLVGEAPAITGGGTSFEGEATPRSEEQ